MAIKIQATNVAKNAAGVPMAPMIDMVFLLLVFFMTASAMSQAGNKFELPLPESGKAEVSEDFSGRFVVSIDEEGSFYLGTNRIELSDLASELQEFQKSQLQGKVSIRAAKGTPFSAIRTVMQQSAAAGLQNYLYATYQAGGE